jgi:hypothetical protein
MLWLAEKSLLWHLSQSDGARFCGHQQQKGSEATQATLPSNN